MQKAEIKTLLAALETEIELYAKATELAATMGLADPDATHSADRLRERGRLLTEARDAISDLAIRCGLLMPPRTVRLSDLVDGREPFELGTMDQLALALGNLIEVFREDGATFDAMARAFRFEADALEAMDAEELRIAGHEPIS